MRERLLSTAKKDLKMTTTYTGRGFDQIVSYIDAHGTSGSLVGKLVRVSGEKIAAVEFSIQNDSLHLFVNGTEYPNVTEAIRDLTNQFSGDATGSNEDGNSANNVIGNYAITRHIIFGNTSLEQIVGRSTVTRARLAKSLVTRSVKVARTLNTEARSGIFKLYDYATIKNIAKRFNLSAQRMSFLLDKLSTNEFELMFGRSDNNFNLSVYKD
jgi:flagellar hook assembly protein FlgD